jgi:hypothetical protein
MCDRASTRFNTPDPYKASGGPSDPSSWNRYSYTRGDPVNRLDPQGLDDCGADWQQDTWMSGPCMNVDGYENVDLAGIWASACNQATMAFGPVPVTDPSCSQYAPVMPVGAPAQPTCAAEYGTPVSIEAAQVAVLLGENSWGLYSASVVGHEDLYMEQAMFNYAAPKGYATSAAAVDQTINWDAYRGVVR